MICSDWRHKKEDCHFYSRGKRDVCGCRVWQPSINLTENLVICKNVGSKVQKAKIWILESLIIYKWRFEDILYGFPYIAAHQQRAWKLRQRLEEFHLMVQNLKPVQCTYMQFQRAVDCHAKEKRCDTNIGLGGQPGNGQGTSKLCSSRRENLVSLSQGFVSFYQFFVLWDNICQIWCCLFFSSNSLLYKGWLWQQKSWGAKRRCSSREDCRIHTSTSEVLVRGNPISR